MDIETSATVVGVSSCPAIATGRGQVVVSTFKSRHSDVWELRLSDGTLIEPTGSHPIFSETRSGYVPARTFQPGEFLRTQSGVLEVASNKAVPRKTWVYNLEVEGEHCYYVLCHNACPEVEDEPEIVRRFTTKKKAKQAKKKGIQYNNTDQKGGGISTTATTIEPVDPDKIRDMTGAASAEYYIDISINGKKDIIL